MTKCKLIQNANLRGGNQAAYRDEGFGSLPFFFLFPASRQADHSYNTYYLFLNQNITCYQNETPCKKVLGGHQGLLPVGV